MAKEFKTLNVTTTNEERTIRAFQGFGWTLLGNQEIYMKDSHSEVWGNQRYSVTETTHYVKLSFERDGSKLKYYQQLRQLENLYWSVKEPKKPNERWKKTFIAEYIVMGGMAFIMFIIPPARQFVLIPALFIGLFVFFHRRYNQKMKIWQDAYNKCWRKRNQILLKAESYLE